jgi:hypothetical protein
VKIVGIDPGVTGAIAMHDAGVLTDVRDMYSADSRTDGAALYEVLDSYGSDVTVYLENTQAMPKNGSIASYSLGLNTGIVVGVVQSLALPLVRVRPAAWKQKMGVTRMDKNAIRGIVREIYPQWANLFDRVKDHNRAEAVLISRYGVAVSLQEAST